MIDKTTTIGPFGDTEKQAVKPWRVPVTLKIGLALISGWLGVQGLLIIKAAAFDQAHKIEQWATQTIIERNLAMPVIVELDSKGKLVVRGGDELTLPEAKKALVYYKLRSEGLQAGLSQVAETLAMAMDAYQDE